MRILMIHPHNIYSVVEPWALRIVHIAREFHKLGHEVKLIYALDYDRSESSYSHHLRLSFETIAVTRYSNTLFKKTQLIKEQARWADVVHFQKSFPWISLPAIMGAYHANRPVHYDWDDLEYLIHKQIESSRAISWFIGYLEKHLPALVDTISVASNVLREVCIGLGFSPHRIFYSPVGVDLQMFHPHTDADLVRTVYSINEPLIIYVGQLGAGQYAEHFLEAAQIIKKRFPESRFMVVGGGPQLKRLSLLTQELGLQKSLLFTDSVPHETIPYYLAAADIAVACFANEQQQNAKSPLKIAEYMAAGKAIVASGVGEVPAMLGNTGIIVTPGNPYALAEGIAVFLNNPMQRFEAGKQARARAEIYCSWEATARNILNAYQCALNGSSMR